VVKFDHFKVVNTAEDASQTDLDGEQVYNNRVGAPERDLSVKINRQMMINNRILATLMLFFDLIVTFLTLYPYK
jgi:hypothetical protein